MSQTESLNIGGRRREIPAMLFVAGWLTLFEYFDQEWESDADLALEGRSLTMFAECGDAEYGGIRFSSVETLCRILGDAAEWSLDRDFDFLDRNRQIILRTTLNSACLNVEVISEWQRLSSREKNAFDECADAMIFPCLVAHGQAQE